MTSRPDGAGPVASRWKATWWILGFGCCVGGWALVSGHLASSPEPRPPAWIAYEAQGERVRLEEAEGVWWVVRPYHAEMDREVLGWMKQGVLDIEETWEPLEGAVEDLEVYGLGDGGVVFTAGRGGVVLHEWRIGDPLVTGKGSYAASASGVVGTTAAHLASLLDLSVQDLRDHHIFRIRPAAVRRITLKGPQGALTVSGQGWDWWIDGWGRADPSKVDALVIGLLDLRVEGWDGPALWPDEGEHRLEIEDESGVVHVALTGPLRGAEVPVWVAAGAQGWVGAERLALLQQGPRSVGVRKVLDVPDPQQIRVRGGGEIVAYDRTPQGWLNVATDAPAPEGVIEALLSLEVDRDQEPRIMEGGPCTVSVVGARHEVGVTLSWNEETATLHATDQAGGLALPLLPSGQGARLMNLCANP